MYLWTKDSANLEYTLQVLSNPKVSPAEDCKAVVPC